MAKNSVQPASCSAAVSPAGSAISETKSTPSAISLTTPDMATCAPTRSISLHRTHTKIHAAASSSSMHTPVRRFPADAAANIVVT